MRRRRSRAVVAALVVVLSLFAGAAVGGAAPSAPPRSEGGPTSEEPGDSAPAPSAKGGQGEDEEGLASHDEVDRRDVNEVLLAFDFSWRVLLYNLGALVLSWLLALPVAWDREQRGASPGLRTFPLVAISPARTCSSRTPCSAAARTRTRASCRGS